MAILSITSACTGCTQREYRALSLTLQMLGGLHSHVMSHIFGYLWFHRKGGVVLSSANIFVGRNLYNRQKISRLIILNLNSYSHILTSHQP